MFSKLVYFLKEQEVPRLSRYLQVCFSRNMSTKETLVQLEKAVQCVSDSKKYSEKELDIGILVLRIGGTRLVKSLNAAGLIPSRSTISRALATKEPLTYKFDMNISIEDLLNNNLSDLDNVKDFISIKMDEIIITDRVRWCSRTNQILGLCYKHKEAINNHKFTNWLTLSDIKDKLENNLIHKSKECLVIAESKT